MYMIPANAPPQGIGSLVCGDPQREVYRNPVENSMKFSRGNGNCRRKRSAILCYRVVCGASVRRNLRTIENTEDTEAQRGTEKKPVQFSFSAKPSAHNWTIVFCKCDHMTKDLRQPRED